MSDYDIGWAEGYASASKEIDRLEKAVKELQRDSDWLICLNGAGVDNWEGISYAHEAFRELFPEYDEE
jgi:hypothetical protein